MDPLTHFLAGGCLGRAGFNRKSALATVTMVLAAEAADIDVLWEFKGSIAGLQHHRGITHSLMGAPFVAAAVLGLVYLVQRLRAATRGRRMRAGRGKVPQGLKSTSDAVASGTAEAVPFRRSHEAASEALPLRWGYLYFCALVAALSHLLLDYSTAYGIRLFAPFNWRWYTWDIVFIIEPLIWLALIAGLILPTLFGLINQEIGARSRGPRGRTGAIAALVCVVAIWGVRDFQHRRALSAMDSFLYHGAVPLRVAAYPYMINPFRWHGVVETAGFFETVPVDSLAPEVRSESEGRIYYKPAEDEVALAAKSSYFGRVYLDWAVFPFLRVQKLEDPVAAYLVEFQDLRYTYPDIRTQRAPLGGYVLLSPELRVLEQRMNASRSPSVESLIHPPAQR